MHCDVQFRCTTQAALHKSLSSRNCQLFWCLERRTSTKTVYIRAGASLVAPAKAFHSSPSISSTATPSSVMNNGPKLPLDVQETIIDESAHNVFTLRHCALTCRDWLPRSRFHLLSAVCISTQEDIYSFCNFLDTHPNYRALVRSVTMAPVSTERRPACLAGVFSISILSRLPRLHGWVIRNDPFRERRLEVSYHPTTLEHLRIRTRTSSPIVNLHLKDLSFVSRGELLRLLASFTQLKHLQCDTIGFGRRDSLDSEGSKPRSLRKLRLSTLLVSSFTIINGTLRPLLITQCRCAVFPGVYCAHC